MGRTIEQILAGASYRPLASIAPFHAALAPERGRGLRGAAAILGYGGGKTFGGAWESMRHLHMNQGMPFLCVCPTFPIAKRTSFVTVCDILDQIGLEYDSRWSGGENSIRIPAWRAQMIWVSAENGDSIKGPNASGAWLDEPGLMADEIRPGQTLWGAVLARIRHPLASSRRLFLTGTPEGVENWLYERVIRNPPPWMTVVGGSTDDNPFAPQDYLDMLTTENYSEQELAAFRHGQFVDLRSGRAYDAFRRNIHLHDGVEYDNKQPVLLTFDWNRDPLHALAAQRDGTTGIKVLREFVIRETTTEEATRAIAWWLEQVGHKAGVEVYGDASGQARHTVSRYNDFEIVRTGLDKRFGPVSERFRRSNPAVVARVGAVNAALRKDRLLIHPSCRVLADDLTRVRYKTGTQELDKSNRALTHASDALGYLVHEALAGPALYTREA